MPSSAEVFRSGADGDPWAERTRPRDLPELMDACTDRAMLAGCLRDLAWANRLTGSYRPTLRFISRSLQRRPASPRPLRILDVGAGYGDVLRRIVRWAASRRLAVELTGIDLHPLTASIAAEATAKAGLPSGVIAWETGNCMEKTAPAPDLIISSLVMHHLEDEEIIAMLRWMEQTARLGWFINDLERQPIPARLWGVLATGMRWHPFLHHDGPVSFRRAFRAADWSRLLARAGVAAEAVSIERVFPARLCVARLR